MPAYVEGYYVEGYYVAISSGLEATITLSGTPEDLSATMSFGGPVELTLSSTLADLAGSLSLVSYTYRRRRPLLLLHF